MSVNHEIVLAATKVTEDKQTVTFVIKGHDEESVLDKKDIIEIRQGFEDDDIILRLSLQVAKEKGIVTYYE